MKKRILIILDTILIFIMLLAFLCNEKTINEKLNLTQSRFLVADKGLSFNFAATPEYQKALAGSTVKIKLNIKDIDMGEERIKYYSGLFTV